MKSPSNNPITLTFGSTESPYAPGHPHQGTDFSYQPDDTIYAPADGVVTLIPNNGADGNGIYMSAEGVQLGLLHSSKYLVSNGAAVKTGQPIGKMGDSGFAFGKHLHWAVKRNNQFIDPLSLIEGEDMSQAQVDELYKKLNETNERLDSIFTNLDNLYKIVNKEVNQLYKLLDQTNKRLDKLEKK